MLFFIYYINIICYRDIYAKLSLKNCYFLIQISTFLCICASAVFRISNHCINSTIVTSKDYVESIVLFFKALQQ